MDTEIVRNCCMSLKQEIEELINKYKQKAGEGVDLVVNVTTQITTILVPCGEIETTKHKVDVCAQIKPRL